MSNFFQYVGQVLAAATVTLTTTSETAIVTTPSPDERIGPALGVLVSGFVNVTPGTGTTAVVVKVRAGSGITGTTLQSTTHTVIAADPQNIAIEYFDNSGTIPVGQYTVTVTQTGASANGSAYGTVAAQLSAEG